MIILLWYVKREVLLQILLFVLPGETKMCFVQMFWHLVDDVLQVGDCTFDFVFSEARRWSWKGSWMRSAFLRPQVQTRLLSYRCQRSLTPWLLQGSLWLVFI